MEHDDPLEADIEAATIGWAERRGWFQRKYKGPGRRSHPDRLFIRHGTVLWIEFKRAGKEPTDLQWREIRKMLAHGALVFWVDNLDDAKAVLAAHE